MDGFIYRTCNMDGALRMMAYRQEHRTQNKTKHTRITCSLYQFSMTDVPVGRSIRRPGRNAASPPARAMVARLPWAWLLAILGSRVPRCCEAGCVQSSISSPPSASACAPAPWEAKANSRSLRLVYFVCTISACVNISFLGGIWKKNCDNNRFEGRQYRIPQPVNDRLSTDNRGRGSHRNKANTTGILSTASTSSDSLLNPYNRQFRNRHLQ